MDKGRFATIALLLEVKLSLLTPWTQRKREEVDPRSFVIAVVDGGDWSTSRPGRFIPGKQTRYPFSRRLFMACRQFGPFWRKQKSHVSAGIWIVYRPICKGKAIPLQAWTGRWGSRKLRFPEFLDSQHMKVVRLSAQRTGHLYPQEISLVLVSVRVWVNLRAIVQPVELSY